MNSIAKHRKEKKLNQSQLAKMTGISRTYISFIENGKNTPSQNELKRISEALNIPIDELLKEDYNDPTMEAIDSIIKITNNNLAQWEKINVQEYLDNISSYSTDIFGKKINYKIGYELNIDDKITYYLVFIDNKSLYADLYYYVDDDNAGFDIFAEYENYSIHINKLVECVRNKTSSKSNKQLQLEILKKKLGEI